LGVHLPVLGVMAFCRMESMAGSIRSSSPMRANFDLSDWNNGISMIANESGGVPPN
jgi:hypothetical protein